MIRSKQCRPRSAVRRGTIAVSLLATFVLVGCGGSSSPARVTFMEPKDGAEVTSPMHVKMSAENFTIEPAGAVNSGRGHLHIMVDTDCVQAGQVIPKDDTHLHFGQGQTEADLQLTSGSHRLCLQAADGAHVALEGDGLKQNITIIVK
jgi:hypothetical protein